VASQGLNIAERENKSPAHQSSRITSQADAMITLPFKYSDHFYKLREMLIAFMEVGGV
jgi:hypothetical protein